MFVHTCLLSLNFTLYRMISKQFILVCLESSRFEGSFIVAKSSKFIFLILGSLKPSINYDEI